MYRLQIYTITKSAGAPSALLAQKPLAPCDDDVPVEVVAVLPNQADGDPPLEEQLGAGVPEFASLDM